MNRQTLTWLLMLAWVFCCMTPVQAQDENDGIAELVMIQPKHGHGPELEAAITDFHHWVADKEGSFRYSWFIIESGPRTGWYIARSGNHDWADFDAEYDWQEEADQKFMADVFPHIEHAERYITEEMQEFQHWPEESVGLKLFQVEHWYVKPGQYGAFRAGLEKIHAALTEGGYAQYYAFNSTFSGAKGNQITLVLPYRDYADMADEDPSFFDIVSEAVGGPEAFETLMQDFGSTYHVGESHLARYLPEASDYGDSD